MKAPRIIGTRSQSQINKLCFNLLSDKSKGYENNIMEVPETKA
jgi:hypothetical protein